MPNPRIEYIASFSSVRKDAEVLLDVLIRIHPPTALETLKRSPLNVALVLDRSGSMSGDRKMEYARKAAVFAVEQLQASDQISVVAFDSQIETVVANTPATHRAAIIEKIQQIFPRGSTALHDAWREGAKQVSDKMLKTGVNRVILLTDGLANVGVTSTDKICSDVNRQKNKNGVGTTTFGMGDEYNEDLLESMARGGDGNYYYIESSGQLPKFFGREFQELAQIHGESVTLSIDPQRQAELVDVFNDFHIDKSGRRQLPNLVGGLPLEIVARFRVPPRAVASEVCRTSLEWSNPSRGGAGESLQSSLIMPTVVGSDWDERRDPVVAERVAVLLATREKLKAAQAAERGDIATSVACLKQSREHVSSVPASSFTMQALDQIGEIEENLKDGGVEKFVRKAKSQVWGHQRSRNDGA